MSLSRLSSRERIVVGVLGAVILLALVGIGILAANLVSRMDEEQAVAGESATAVSEGPGQPAEPTEAVLEPGAAGGTEALESPAQITPVATPVLLEAAPPAPDLAPAQVVVRTVGAGGLAPVVIADQALQPGRRYRIEIHAVDGSRVEIHGSWSQAAVAAGGTLSAPTIEFFEGQTPYRIELSLPMADPARWSCSVSAALKAPPLASGQSALSGPTLAIEILDVTDSQ